MLAFQALVGLLGFWYHLRMNLMEPGTSLFEKSVNGAPPMAPLLFPNLVALTLIGLWELAAHLPAEEPSTSSFFSRMMALAPAEQPNPEI